MTPKDKALELYNKYEQLSRDFTRGVSMKEFAKQCALIAVKFALENPLNSNEYNKYLNEIINEIELL
jgi:hypothetical protein